MIVILITLKGFNTSINVFVLLITLAACISIARVKKEKKKILKL